MADGTTPSDHDNVIALGDLSPPVPIPWEVWRFCFERASEHWWAAQKGRLSGGMPEENWRVIGFGIISGRDEAAMREGARHLWGPEAENDNVPENADSAWSCFVEPQM